jgi:hypothetical protein
MPLDIPSKISIYVDDKKIYRERERNVLASMFLANPDILLLNPSVMFRVAQKLGMPELIPVWQKYIQDTEKEEWKEKDVREGYQQHLADLKEAFSATTSFSPPTIPTVKDDLPWGYVYTLRQRHAVPLRGVPCSKTYWPLIKEICTEYQGEKGSVRKDKKSVYFKYEDGREKNIGTANHLWFVVTQYSMDFISTYSIGAKYIITGTEYILLEETK